MLDGIIEYHKLMEMHVEYLEQLKRGSSMHHMKLVSRVLHLDADKKGRLQENYGDLLHYLVDCGEANLTHEMIDKKYKKKRNEDNSGNS